MSKYNNLTIEEEVALLTRGCEEVFPEGELMKKVATARKENRPLRVKLGVDPTATDLHLGHLIPALKLRVFQDLGHQAVLIIGDYTATVGDPSGQNKERPQLDHETVLKNAATYRDQLFRVLDSERTEIVYNGKWFSAMEFHDVIRLLSQTTVARMLEREDFAERMKKERPISLHELVYPLMQGYDSAMVRADVELGGIDQKFNILVGRDIQRSMGMEPQVGVCNPILLGTDGHEKMSKSLGNTIGLTDAPDDMFGKVMSIPDDLMPMYFEQITQLSTEQINQIMKDVSTGVLHPRDAKRTLARNIVERFYSADVAQQADDQFMQVFSKGELPEELQEVKINGSQLENGKIWIVRLIVVAGFASTNGEARRFVQQGAVKLDGVAVTDPTLDCAVEDGMILQVGRRRLAKVRIN